MVAQSMVVPEVFSLLPPALRLIKLRGFALLDDKREQST